MAESKKSTKKVKDEEGAFEISVKGKHLEGLGSDFKQVCYHRSGGAGCGGIYGLGFLGALIYFISTSIAFETALLAS